MKKVVLIDIDGCMCSLTDTANRLREKEGLPPITPPTTWDWSGAKPEDRDFMLNKCYTSPSFYAQAWLLPFVKNALWFLSNHYELVVITARAFYQQDEGKMSQEIADTTAKWLRRWELPEHKLLHCGMKHKGEFARQMFGDNIAFAIEDSPHAVQSYVDAEIMTYVVSYPYNSEFQNDVYVKRVSTFEQIAWDRVMRDNLDAPMSQRRIFDCDVEEPAIDEG